mmetsp:Transcript_41555/g.124168  ORF Transcript_41555/g.124168 Transcript_41555/m.124168 type:complete len:212 (+) Transcript_41555:460-1095(+)
MESAVCTPVNGPSNETTCSAISVESFSGMIVASTCTCIWLCARIRVTTCPPGPMTAEVAFEGITTLVCAASGSGFGPSLPRAPRAATMWLKTSPAALTVAAVMGPMMQSSSREVPGYLSPSGLNLNSVPVVCWISLVTAPRRTATSPGKSNNFKAAVPGATLPCDSSPWRTISPPQGTESSPGTRAPPLSQLEFWSAGSEAWCAPSSHWPY